MKVFVYFDISIAKTGVFIDIFTYSSVRKSTIFYPNIFNQMPLIVISVDISGVAGGKRKGRLASNSYC